MKKLTFSVENKVVMGGKLYFRLHFVQKKIDGAAVYVYINVKEIAGWEKYKLGDDIEMGIEEIFGEG